MGILSAVVAFFLFLYAPAIYLRDMKVNILRFFFSMPAAAILAPVTGWVVGRLLWDGIQRDLARDVPSPARVMVRVLVVFAILVAAAVGTLFAVTGTPGWSWSSL
jgi:hypothetical protein